ncbi:endoglucanase [Komagataeibacter xylinus]|uniref:endoglucanase n=1 Tax=Komagataeibacter xylinus TaxID=28448 RepID=UPI00280AAB97|nr:endoglucanase [Komagataeibacter xylinus]
MSTPEKEVEAPVNTDNQQDVDRMLTDGYGVSSAGFHYRAFKQKRPPKPVVQHDESAATQAAATEHAVEEAAQHSASSYDDTYSTYSAPAASAEDAAHMHDYAETTYTPASHDTYAAQPEPEQAAPEPYVAPAAASEPYVAAHAEAVAAPAYEPAPQSAPPPVAPPQPAATVTPPAPEVPPQPVRQEQPVASPAPTRPAVSSFMAPRPATPAFGTTASATPPVAAEDWAPVPKAQQQRGQRLTGPGFFFGAGSERAPAARLFQSAPVSRPVSKPVSKVTTMTKVDKISPNGSQAGRPVPTDNSPTLTEVFMTLGGRATDRLVPKPSLRDALLRKREDANGDS